MASNHHIPGCDGSGPCCKTESTLKLLPTSGDGNAILCRSCWDAEIRFRREHNRERGTDFPVPSWKSGKVYGANPKPKKMTMAEVRAKSLASGHHWFSRRTMKFFKETMRDYRVGETLESGLVEILRIGGRCKGKTAYFNPKNGRTNINPFTALSDD